jgi:hypothetical protein
MSQHRTLIALLCGACFCGGLPVSAQSVHRGCMGQAQWKCGRIGLNYDQYFKCGTSIEDIAGAFCGSINGVANDFTQKRISDTPGVQCGYYHVEITCLPLR